MTNKQNQNVENKINNTQNTDNTYRPDHTKGTTIVNEGLSNHESENAKPPVEKD